MTDEVKYAELTGRVSRLEEKPRDAWDILQILTPLLIPLAIAYVGHEYARTSKEIELQSQERRAQRDSEIAATNARVGQANVIASLIDGLLSTDPKRQKLAAEAVLIAIPDTGPALVRVVSESDTADPLVREFARDALATRRANLVAGLFSESPAQRGDAYSALVAGWANDAAIVPLVIEHARDDPDNLDGVYNSLVLLSHLSRDAALRPHAAELRAFANEMESKGPRIKERAEKLRMRIP